MSKPQPLPELTEDQLDILYNVHASPGLSGTALWGIIAETTDMSLSAFDRARGALIAYGYLIAKIRQRHLGPRGCIGPGHAKAWHITRAGEKRLKQILEG